MLESVMLRTFVPLLLRMALAVVFIYHGLDKVKPEAGYGMTWADGKMVMPAWQQGAVAWGELLGGIAIALGLLTRPAAAGIIIIMAGAIKVAHGAHGFSMQGGGFEYNFVLICVAAALALGGAGTFSLDRVIRVKMRGPSRY